MKLSPFTLIYQPEVKIATPKGSTASLKAKSEISNVDAQVKDARKKSPQLVKALHSVNPQLSRTLIASTYAQKEIAPTEQVTRKLQRVLKELRQSKSGITVAIWDLDAKLAELSGLIEALNKSQPIFTWFELQAPVPAGLVVQSEGFKQWALERFNWHVKKKDEKEFENNLLFDDFYNFAREVRQQIGVDFLLGITQQMVAFQEDGLVYWNYFSTYEEQVVLSSAYKIPEYAKTAGRPLEVASVAIAIAQMLQLLNKRVRYHPENRGCLYDYNEARETIVETIRKMQIEPECLALIDEKYRDAADKMVGALRNYSAKPVEVEKTAKRTTSKKDDSYWLQQLNKLSRGLAKAKGSSR